MQIQHVRRSGSGVRLVKGRGPRIRRPVFPIRVTPQIDLHPELGFSCSGTRPRRQAKHAEWKIPTTYRKRTERLRQSGDRDGADAGKRAGVRCRLQVRQNVRMVAGAWSLSRIGAG